MKANSDCCFCQKDCAESNVAILQSRLERSLKEGRIATWCWNPRTGEFSDLGNFEYLLGFTLEELLQTYHDGAELVPEEDRKNVMRSLNDHLGGNIPYFSADFRMRHKRGHYVWFHAQGKIVEYDEMNRPFTMTGTVQDISEKVEMDQQLRQTQKMEAIGSLASGIAHDFNNLLQVITGYAEMAKEKCFEASVDTDEIDEILTAGDKAMMLVRQLLSFSRVQEQQLTNINVSRILPEMVKLLRPFIGDLHDIEFICDQSNLEISGDAVQIEQLLLNLCLNARDSMPDGGTIGITVESEILDNDIVTILGRIPVGEYTVLSICDTGCGIDPAVQDRIFEPFFSTRNIGRGTGLGLAIVYAIVKRHNAFMRLVSETDKGATIYVYFPACMADDSPVAASLEETAPANIPASDKLEGSETILLAEDDTMVRRLAERTLSRAGYNVISVENGMQACAKFLETPESVDLLILDMIMPEMNGKDAFEKISSQSERNVPVLFASGFSSDLLENEFMMKTPGRLLEKPYQKNQLLKMVRDLLDGK